MESMLVPGSLRHEAVVPACEVGTENHAHRMERAGSTPNQSPAQAIPRATCVGAQNFALAGQQFDAPRTCDRSMVFPIEPTRHGPTPRAKCRDFQRALVVELHASLEAVACANDRHMLRRRCFRERHGVPQFARGPRRLGKLLERLSYLLEVQVVPMFALDNAPSRRHFALASALVRTAPLLHKTEDTIDEKTARGSHTPRRWRFDDQRQEHFLRDVRGLLVTVGRAESDTEHVAVVLLNDGLQPPAIRPPQKANESGGRRLTLMHWNLSIVFGGHPVVSAAAQNPPKFSDAARRPSAAPGFGAGSFPVRLSIERKVPAKSSSVRRSRGVAGPREYARCSMLEANEADDPSGTTIIGRTCSRDVGIPSMSLGVGSERHQRLPGIRNGVKSAAFACDLGCACYPFEQA